MIYDCFQFYNELELLEVRLNELNDVVDCFVLVESELTHSLKEKELFYSKNKDLFKSFSHKIQHVIVKANEFCDNPETNDNIQRKAIATAIRDAENNDIILISDLDEIPKAATLVSYLQATEDIKPSVFSQYFFYYYMNTFLSINGSNINYGTTMFKKKDIINDIQSCRSGFNRNNVYCKIDDGGWHFSYLGDLDQVINKIRNFCHSRDFGHLSDEQIQFFHSNLQDPLGRGSQYALTKANDLTILPKYVQQHIEKFKKFIKE